MRKVCTSSRMIQSSLRDFSPGFSMFPAFRSAAPEAGYANHGNAEISNFKIGCAFARGGFRRGYLVGAASLLPYTGESLGNASPQM